MDAPHVDNLVSLQFAVEMYIIFFPGKVAF